MIMEKSCVMMMHQTDKEHEQQEEACSTSEVRHAEKSGLLFFVISIICRYSNRFRYRCSYRQRGFLVIVLVIVNKLTFKPTQPTKGG